MLRLKILSILGLDVRNAVNAGHLILILVVDYTEEVGNVQMVVKQINKREGREDLGGLDGGIIQRRNK